VASAVAYWSGGLSEAEARKRLDDRAAARQPRSSRSYASIVRANVFTVFNLILLVAGVATLVFGEWQDALFLGVLVSNSTIGIVQEVRAKRALDRLAALVAPTATVVRDGEERPVPAEDVVVGDLVRLAAGDQVVADGTLVSSEALLLDESILTGESEPVARDLGEGIRSGSFAVEGTGLFSVEAVGEASYAARITGEARAFRHPRSPLELALNRLLIVLVAIMAPLGVLIGFALWERHTPLRHAVPTSVAAVVTMVPEGLILLATLTYAVAALRIARHGALAQQLNAIESLASVDVVCLDKTGTLTEARPRVVEITPAPGVAEQELAAERGRDAAATAAPNTTLEAIATAYAQPAEEPAASVPFSAARRWSALELGDATYVLGAPELFPLAALEPQAERAAAEGRRVLALARTTNPAELDALPSGLKVRGLVVLAERLRPDARATVDFFRSQGVALKILSGDRPETVAAIARDAGIRSERPPLDASNPPPIEDVLAANVIGRIDPSGKRRVVEALRDSGRYVAMVGDGVNDVPALKAARLAIAQGTGTQMARSVADLVLVRGDFGSVPLMVAEGRKVLRNLQRVAKLFVTKSAFAAFLILSIGLTTTPYPLLPRHLTLAASLTIGVPGFFLALAPSGGRFASKGFLRDVAAFAVPAGTAAGLGVVSSYLFALNVLDLRLIEARTVATTVLIGVGLYLILALEASARRRGAAVTALCAALAASYGATLALPATRAFFELALPSAAMVLTAIVGIALAAAGLWLVDERFVPGAHEPGCGKAASGFSPCPDAGRAGSGDRYGMSTILVGTDGSATAQAAIRVALDLAQASGDDVLFVTAWHELEGDLGLPIAKLWPELVEVEREWAETTLASAADEAEAAGVPATTSSRHGTPADQICKVARERHPRLIVVGSRGWGPVDGVLFGSVSSGVLRHAPCPVLVVPAAGEPAEAEPVEVAVGTSAGKE
jgi:cation-transporting P-type ATPase E